MPSAALCAGSVRPRARAMRSRTPANQKMCYMKESTDNPTPGAQVTSGLCGTPPVSHCYGEFAGCIRTCKVRAKSRCRSAVPLSRDDKHS